MTQPVVWDPGQYQRYAAPRLRPAIELLQHVTVGEPGSVCDLGCGDGQVTWMMAERWPRARILGLDSSADMLAAARRRAAGHPEERARSIDWLQADISSWRPESRFDVVFSNAVLHWVDERHRPLVQRLASYLRGTGSCLAIQVPMNWDSPSHRLIGESVRALSLPQARATAALEWADRQWVASQQDYYLALAEVADSVDMWSTEYLHQLTGDDPVLEWVKGTALRPVLASLQSDDRERFMDVYRRGLREAYPALPDGTTLFPFRRLFMVATV